MTQNNILKYESSGGNGAAIVESLDRDHSFQKEHSWIQDFLRFVCAGSAVCVGLAACEPYLPRVGTSPSLFDTRSTTRTASMYGMAKPAVERALTALQAAMTMSVADQAHEVLAALSLNKTQLAEVLGISRPTLYDWLEGKEPTLGNAQRLTTLLRILIGASISSSNPLNARFVRHALGDRDPTLLQALSARAIDEQLVSRLVQTAKALGEEAESRRVKQERRLKALGFEEPSDDQRREQLARTVALLDWPKGPKS